MNWGGNLTLTGAMRLSGWIVLNTMFAAMNGRLFIDWAEKSSSPKCNEKMFLFLLTFALTTIRNFDPCAPNSASRSPIFHLIRTISIPLSLAGLFKNSTYASMLLGTATPCAARSVSSQAAPLQAVVSACRIQSRLK